MSGDRPCAATARGGRGIAVAGACVQAPRRRRVRFVLRCACGWPLAATTSILCVARARELVKRAPRLLAPRPRRAPIPITLCMLSPLSGLRHVGFQGVSNYVALCRASYPSMVWIAQLGAPGDEEKKIGGCYFERTFTRVSFGAKIHWCAFLTLAAKFLDLTRIGKLMS